MEKKKVDIVVIGGSLGGCLAAYSAAKEGYQVILTEETDWIGGQLTNQGVPSDEHEFIERFGCTKTYRTFRNKVREYYRNHPYFLDEIKANAYFNPGSGWVSRIAHEPRVALHLIQELLLPYVSNGKLEVWTNYKPVFVKTKGNKVQTIVVEDTKTGIRKELIGRFFIDGTDTGELLPLSGTEYVTGAEGPIYEEPHANPIPDPEDQQPITWVAAVSFHEGEQHEMEKPEMYDYFRSIKMDYGDGPVDLLSFFGPSLNGKGKRQFKLFGELKENSAPPLFSYRQIVDKTHFHPEYAAHDATLINWPQNDYIFGNIFDTPDAEYHKYMAKQLTLSLIYWLKTEAIRDDGRGQGYPELKLRGDILGTETGLAQAPYIRESRRIKALYTVKEQDISKHTNDSLPHFWDTVGVGLYHIDLHMTTKTRTHFYIPAWPFEIPLGALIPIRVENLLPAGKNIGTTHITNGCFRLHPVEWNIGEVAGYLAAYLLKGNMTPQELYRDRKEVQRFQEHLEKNGIELHWPDEVEMLYNKNEDEKNE